MANSHIRESLTWSQGIQYALYGIGNIIRQGIIFTCVNTDYEGRVFRSNLNDFPDDRFQFPNVVHFFTNEVTACDIWIYKYSVQGLQVRHKIVQWRNIIFHDGQWCTSESSKET